MVFTTMNEFPPMEQASEANQDAAVVPNSVISHICHLHISIHQWAQCPTVKDFMWHIVPTTWLK